MTTPLVEVLDLTYAMLAAAQACDWPEFRYLQERRAKLIEPGLYTCPDAPWRLPQLFAAQTELAAIRHDDDALNDAAEMLGPISEALVEALPEPRDPWRSAEVTP
ncbi:MAG TPA: hypothetical protein VFP92_10260 [Rhodanobacteraceae bacterium]|nr:hypothetical protein [Oleiagrimonas sp.]HET9819535.1 hypothetical protein [Rhodanobacteraceae bacterium]